jgi:RNA polymerase sigma-70 factor (sigma-E family)
MTALALRPSIDIGASPDALDALYRAEHGPMVRLAFLLTGSAHAADDLVHEAFLRVAPRIGTVANPGGYLRQVVVNLARDHHRRTKRWQPVRQARPDDAVVLPPVVDETWAAVQRLPGPRRTAVVLRYYADLSYDQIAEAMGCPVGTAKSHVHRGLQELREVLDA